MKKINYSQTYQKFTKGLSPKTKDIFDPKNIFNPNKKVRGSIQDIRDAIAKKN